MLEACVQSVSYLAKMSPSGIPIKLCKTGIFGVPKEPRIMQMDWKALGYERVWVNGKIRWIPQDNKDRKDQDTSS
jgi:hypothetical protein